MSSHLPCAGCSGPHRFDTTLPSVQWNRVIRAKGLPEYLCTTCIVEAFAKAGESFTAQLYGAGFDGVAIEVRINNVDAITAAYVSEENTELRCAVRESVDHVQKALDRLTTVHARVTR